MFHNVRPWTSSGNPRNPHETVQILWWEIGDAYKRSKAACQRSNDTDATRVRASRTPVIAAVKLSIQRYLTEALIVNHHHGSAETCAQVLECKVAGYQLDHSVRS